MKFFTKFECIIILIFTYITPIYLLSSRTEDMASKMRFKKFKFHHKNSKNKVSSHNSRFNTNSPFSNSNNLIPNKNNPISDPNYPIPTLPNPSNSDDSKFESKSYISDNESNLGKQLFKITGNIDLSDLNIGDGPIFYEGWIKYFKYESIETGSRPKAFFKNLAFNDQFRINPKLDKSTKINGILKYIPSETSFFIKLFNDRINILTSRLVINNIIIE